MRHPERFEQKIKDPNHESRAKQNANTNFTKNDELSSLHYEKSIIDEDSERSIIDEDSEKNLIEDSLMTNWSDENFEQSSWDHISRQVNLSQMTTQESTSATVAKRLVTEQGNVSHIEKGKRDK